MGYSKRLLLAFRKTLFSTLLIALVSCSSTPTELTIEDKDWVFEDRAIEILVKAPTDLNSVSGRPHSLAIGVFQLNDPNTFTGLSATREGAVELLQKGRIDDTVANFSIINVRPGEQRMVSINRAQTAQYVGVIAGYFELNPKKDVKVFPIPLKEVQRGVVEKALALATLISDEAKALPDKLRLFADLGRASSKQIIDVDEDKVKLEQAKADKSSDEGQEIKPSMGWFDKAQKVVP